MIEPFFHEKMMTDAVYLDMLENYAVPKVLDGYIFQQNLAPPHFWTPATEFLIEHKNADWSNCPV